jgi:hypothetical protein
MYWKVKEWAGTPSILSMSMMIFKFWSKLDTPVDDLAFYSMM